jgi:hypothetical protein
MDIRTGDIVYYKHMADPGLTFDVSTLFECIDANYPDSRTPLVIRRSLQKNPKYRFKRIATSISMPFFVYEEDWIATEQTLAFTEKVPIEDLPLYTHWDYKTSRFFELMGRI